MFPRYFSHSARMAFCTYSYTRASDSDGNFSGLVSGKSACPSLSSRRLSHTMSYIVSISSSSVFQASSAYSSNSTGIDCAEILQALVLMPTPRGEISRPSQMASNVVDLPPWNSPTRAISKLLRFNFSTTSVSSARVLSGNPSERFMIPSIMSISSLRRFS